MPSCCLIGPELVGIMTHGNIMNSMTVPPFKKTINILEPTVQSHVAAETLQVCLTTAITTCPSATFLAGQSSCVVVAGVKIASEVSDLLVAKGFNRCIQVHGSEVWHQVPTEAVLPVVVARIAWRICWHLKFELCAADHCCVAVTALLADFNYVENRPPAVEVCKCVWRSNNKLDAKGRPQDACDLLVSFSKRCILLDKLSTCREADNSNYAQIWKSSLQGQLL
mmetsp:Transcript_15324/g.30140  ORF Transcript_15324/g.30140 Transcript_15324/m.30140 type:complete len:224 (+) Transcript_15324:55-726(+)